MKKCSMCAEEIQDEAIKCKHCGSSLGPGVNYGALLAVVLVLLFAAFGIWRLTSDIDAQAAKTEQQTQDWERQNDIIRKNKPALDRLKAQQSH